jgi:hypothetical protein
MKKEIALNGIIYKIGDILEAVTNETNHVTKGGLFEIADINEGDKIHIWGHINNLKDVKSFPCSNEDIKRFKKEYPYGNFGERKKTLHINFRHYNTEWDT